MPDRVITLTCDFGDKFAIAQMELVVQGISPITKFIVLSNEIKEYSIIEGSFVILKGYKFAPCGSVHIGIVDPGVGSDRRGVAIKTKNCWFVGPDNGLLYPAAKSDGIISVYTVNENALGNITNTFHGRDVFAKVAAKIATGENISQFLLPTDKPLITLDFIRNQVVHIDPYGNIKINRKLKKEKSIKMTLLEAEPQDISTMRLPAGKAGPSPSTQKNARINNARRKVIIIPVVKTFSDVPVGNFLAYTGSHGILEIAINQGNAAKHTALQVGELFEIF